jgi:hypothetical protein
VRIRRWPAVTIIGAILATIAVTWIAIGAHPDALRVPGASFLPLGLAVVACGYVVAAVAFLQRPRAGAVEGVWFGVAAGVLWSAEITGGGPAMFSRPVEVAVGATCSLAAVVATAAAGITGAVRGGWRAGLITGGFAGLISGIVDYLYAVPMTLLSLDLLGGREDYQAQFASSRAPTMPAFLTQDALAGYGAHLIINPVVGLVGAGIGAMVHLGIRGSVGSAGWPNR